MISIKRGIDCAPRRYDTGMSKIAFLATHLEGNAQEWYDGVFGLPAEQRPEWLRNWVFNLFSTEFLRVWGPYNPIKQATTRMFSNGFLQGEMQKISEFLQTGSLNSSVILPLSMSLLRPAFYGGK